MKTPILALAALALPLSALAQPAASPQPSTREIERVNWMELREFVPARSQTVLLPLGTLEAHGVTANGADILAPVAIARDIAPSLDAFVAPVIAYGFTGSMDAQGVRQGRGPGERHDPALGRGRTLRITGPGD